jgi:hypothetical protein
MLKQMGTDIGSLCQEKNIAYGDSFAKSGDILKILYPDGIQPDQYQDALGIIRVIDKLFRLATDKDAFGESPWKDIAGYGILGAVQDAQPKDKEGGWVTMTDFDGHSYTQPKITKSCIDCDFERVPLDEMPCKKCNLHPVKPHHSGYNLKA